MTDQVNLAFQIFKADEEQRVVFGWASVISEKGNTYVDLQDDVIEAHELLKATTDFMLDSRVGKVDHSGGRTGEIVHSLPLTKDIAESLGMSIDKEGWVVGYKVFSDAVWQRVKSGELKAFSIGATAERIPF